MTFCDTWVVDKIVVTHLRNPRLGVASDARGACGISVVVGSAILWSIADDSNHKRQVI